ncbi:hypothetical protein FH508_0011100 [Lysinibacillus sp. CD3-6]|uniref:hypothetical protein n=1 Tax=Lysinibacillus sp. CD3-6 TaxID=2892541 RepID=UPI00116B48F5|nr:hypothetical protein [Lysinibacillus sp. CD3-6]UED82416.1 hypothetical protein FH508_0011100 [Lysinibacillus sp. CD3-6]
MAIRTDAYNTGKAIGEALNNSKVGQTFNSAAKKIGNVFVDYGKAINKAAQQTVYGNIETPYGTAGGAIKGLFSGGLKSAVKGAGTGMLLEFGLRSATNIYNDVIRGSK